MLQVLNSCRSSSGGAPLMGVRLCTKIKAPKASWVTPTGRLRMSSSHATGLEKLHVLQWWGAVIGREALHKKWSTRGHMGDPYKTLTNFQ